MELYLGVDVGGSKTRALVADSSGRALGYGEAGAGNHEVVGYDGLRIAVRSAVSAALAEASRSGSRKAPDSGADWALDWGRSLLRGAGFGVAGFDWPSEEAETRASLGAALGLRCPIVLRNDAALGLAAGSVSGLGVNLSAGTSNNCYGLWRSGDGEVEGRISGAGPVVGEEGGGREIAIDALRAVNHARIRRGAPTAITAFLLDATGSRTADALIESIAAETLQPDASWAPLVFRAAAEGDGAALAIIERAGRELGESAAAVVRQIGAESEDFDLVLSGSLFSLKPDLFRGVEAVLRPVAPRFREVRLGAPPVLGAVVLGMRCAGLEPKPLLSQLRSSSLALVEPRPKR